MTNNDRDAAAIVKLLRVAMSKTDDASRRLAALRSAHAGVTHSLGVLADAISGEEEAAKAAEVVGFMQLAGYLAGASQKRAVLESSAASLAAEIEATESLLQETFAETKKLEHLIERARLQTDKLQRRRDAAALDDFALARFGAGRAGR